MLKFTSFYIFASFIFFKSFMMTDSVFYDTRVVFITKTIGSKIYNSDLLKINISSNLNLILSGQDNLEKQIEQLRKEHDKLLVEQANSTRDIAFLVIQWSAFFITFFTIGLAIIGFLGIKEYRILKSRSKELDDLKIKFENDLKEFKNKTEGRLTKLQKEFVSRSQKLIKAAHDYSMGISYYSQGDNQEAIKCFKRAEELQPENNEVLCKIGRAYTNLENPEKAEEYFNKVRKNDPNNIEALRGLAILYRYNTESSSLALEYIQKAIEIDSNDYRSLDYQGLLYRDKGEFNKALESHEKAYKIKKRSETLFCISLIQAQNGDYENAKTTMNRAMDQLSQEVPDGKIRPIWEIATRAGKYIIDGNHQEALKLANETNKYLTTKRLTQAFQANLKFLLEALGKHGLIEEYMKAFNIQRIPGL